MSDTDPTPAEQLRTAAALIRQRANAATPGPWRATDITKHGSAVIHGPDALQDGGYDPTTKQRRQVMRPRVVVPPDVDYGPTVDLPDAEHIAAWHPAVALAVADWLDRAAQCWGTVEYLDWGALYVARAYLGTAQVTA